MAKAPKTDVAPKCQVCGISLMFGSAHNCRPPGEVAKQFAPVPRPKATKAKLTANIVKASGGKIKLASHPDCQRCNANRERSKLKARERRGK